MNIYPVGANVFHLHLAFALLHNTCAKLLIEPKISKKKKILYCPKNHILHTSPLRFLCRLGPHCGKKIKKNKNKMGLKMMSLGFETLYQFHPIPLSGWPWLGLIYFALVQQSNFQAQNAWSLVCWAAKNWPQTAKWFYLLVKHLLLTTSNTDLLASNEYAINCYSKAQQCVFTFSKWHKS